jgi:pectinesterase
VRFAAFVSFGLVCAVATAAQDRPAKYDAIVAADGSGDHRTVQAAINAAPQTTAASRRWVIFVKAGTYQEIVYVQREKRHVALVGEDPARTRITYHLKASDVGLDGQPIGTFRTPTVFIDADDFSAENLTFENAAGPVGQALAVRVDGDRVVFRNMRFLGWQDTMLLNRGRHYIEDSLVTGHVDFIFGGATAFFARCRIHIWRDGYITAPSTPAEQPFGFVFQQARITAANAETRTYLGRPWRDAGATTFIDSTLAAVVRPAGWHNWDQPAREKTARFAEFGSTGVGATPAARVAWATYGPAADAKAITIERVLGGADRWNPVAVPSSPSTSRALAEPLPAPPGPGAPDPTPPQAAASAPVAWSAVLRQAPAWYGSAEARRIASNVKLYQRSSGGWPKDIDMAKPSGDDEQRAIAAARSNTDSTIDNGATVTQMRFLLRVFTAQRDIADRDAFLRGLDYLLAAQYPNGGWPQFFPLRTDYSRHITFNDDALIGVATLLREVGAGTAGEFVDPARRERARDAVTRAVQLILAAQIRDGGRLTGWCQQHDAKTLAPVGARSYEHPSTSGSETVGITRFLMEIDNPSPEIVAAVEGAVTWLRSVAIKGWRLERRADSNAPGGYDNVLVEDASAPPLWARFYELRTNRPIYSGRDGVVRYRLADIEIERRTGYSWIGPYAATLLNDLYPKWRARRVSRDVGHRAIG